MKNLFRTTLCSVIIASSLMIGCDKKNNTGSKVKTTEKEKPLFVFNNHRKNEVFDPSKWIWGVHFEIKKWRHNDNFLSLPQFECDKTIFLEGLIIDSIRFCHDKEYIPDGWLTLYMGSKLQNIKIRSYVNDWVIGGPSCNNAIMFGHYNTDNYLDFRIYSNTSGTSGIMNQIYLYNPNKREFENSEPLFCPALRYDRKHNIYQTWSRGGPFNFRAEQFTLIAGKKKSLRAIDVQIIEMHGGKRLLRHYMTQSDTLLKLYRMEDIYRDNDVLFKRDKHYKDFHEFRMKYTLI